ncbi:MAG: hypothetical protein OJF52_000712 [Nitrospira sp.]|jgi:hypothetical protein|nr:MAG: hypothetical protein OJF52_000712 [Nitrospira sp.]
MNTAALPSWDQTRSRLLATVPQFYELEPGGALALDLGDDGWLLEVRPDGQLLCQHGIAMDDVKSLMCDGTTEDLGTDEVAKQAKYFLGPAVSKMRPALLKAGFAEQTDMNDDYVAITFLKGLDFQRPDEVMASVRWCQNLFSNRA